MAHHNFYESLGLDRSKDSAALRAEINEKLGAGGLTDALRDELQVASQVLGDSRRRAAYDSRLDDPNAPTITVAALRELARVDFGPEPKPEPVSYTHLTLPTIHVECRSRWSPYH